MSLVFVVLERDREVWVTLVHLGGGFSWPLRLKGLSIVFVRPVSLINILLVLDASLCWGELGDGGQRSPGPSFQVRLYISA